MLNRQIPIGRKRGWVDEENWDVVEFDGWGWGRFGEEFEVERVEGVW